MPLDTTHFLQFIHYKDIYKLYTYIYVIKRRLSTEENRSKLHLRVCRCYTLFTMPRYINFSTVSLKMENTSWSQLERYIIRPQLYFSERKLFNGISEGQCLHSSKVTIISESEREKASLVAQRVKNLLTMRTTWVSSLGREDPPEKGMVTHSRILAWRIPWTEEPVRLVC